MTQKLFCKTEQGAFSVVIPLGEGEKDVIATSNLVFLSFLSVGNYNNQS